MWWAIALACIACFLSGAGLVFWWVARSTHVTADREINGWPAYHVGYLRDSDGKLLKRVKAYAVRESFAHWHLWSTIDDANPSRVSFRPKASKAELLEMAYNPRASEDGSVVVPVDG